MSRKAIQNPKIHPANADYFKQNNDMGIPVKFDAEGYMRPYFGIAVNGADFDGFYFERDGFVPAIHSETNVSSPPATFPSS